MNNYEPNGQKTILLIDDQPENLSFLVNYLEDLGYELVVSQSGESGLLRAEHVQPALILLDVVMPDIDGFAICERLKLNTQTGDIPVIFMTGRSSAEDIVRGFEVGGVDYLSKPVRLEEAKARIESHLTICELQKELQEREAHYRSIVETVSDSLFVLNNEAVIVDINPSALKTYGYSRSELIGTPFSQLVSLEYQAVFKDFQNKLKEVRSFSGEIIELKKDGTDINVEVRGSIIQSEGKKLWVMATRDVTERKKFETERANLNKLEAMATLAGGIAHDFVNLLSVVLGYIDLAKLRGTMDSRGIDDLNKAEEASIQATNLARKFITFSSGGDPIKKKCSIGQLITNSATPSFKNSSVQIAQSIADNILAVEVDPGQMNQVFRCVFSNAKEAMPKGGGVRICADNFEINRLNCNEFNGLSRGKYILLTIEDEGIGIAEKNLAMVFDPYFSTKEMGNVKGQGLGLSIAHSVIKKHGGIIKIESQLGSGSRVRIYLPAVE